MEHFYHRNPNYRQTLRIAFPFVHILCFIGLPLMAFMLRVFDVILLDYVWIIFISLFGLLFLGFRFSLALKASDVEFEFSDSSLKRKTPRGQEIILDDQIKHVVFSLPLIVIRTEGSTLDKVFHIVFTDKAQFDEVKSLTIFKKEKG